MVSGLKISLINKSKDIGDVYTFVFDSVRPFTWKSGQHAVFSFDESFSEGNRQRVFSIASSPDEKVISIATRIGENPSAFKSKLLELQKGDIINIRGPYGSFVVTDETENIVGVAGGIGITPFRAILYDIYKGLSTAKIELIYSGRDYEYPFREDMSEFEKSENIAIHYTATKEEVSEILDSLVSKYQNRAEYYVSGSPKMVEELGQRLEASGVENIKNDPFLGY